MLTQRISNDRSTEYRTASRISIVTHLAWYHIKLVIHIQATFAIIFRSFWYMDLPFKYHDKFPVTLCYLWKLRTYNLKNHPSLLLEFHTFFLKHSTSCSLYRHDIHALLLLLANQLWVNDIFKYWRISQSFVFQTNTQIFKSYPYSWC